jgi:hypothetical protein
MESSIVQFVELSLNFVELCFWACPGQIWPRISGEATPSLLVNCFSSGLLAKFGWGLGGVALVGCGGGWGVVVEALQWLSNFTWVGVGAGGVMEGGNDYNPYIYVLLHSLINVECLGSLATVHNGSRITDTMS